MGYQIQYGPTKCRRRERKPRKTSYCLLVAICALVLMAGLHFSGIGTGIKTWLIPGDPEVTVAALERFVAELKGGTAISDAVTAFCEEIIDNAVYSQ